MDTTVLEPVSEEAVSDEGLYFRVLGRTLEHFGVQMYKRREVAIAELVANCWDAGATEVFVEVPETDSYDKSKSHITVRDTGSGMSLDEVRKSYLVLGRNRRTDSGGDETQTKLRFYQEERTTVVSKDKIVATRKVMGRKGIGKLAGFGLAQNVTVTTWKDGVGIEFYLNLRELKVQDSISTNVPIKWNKVDARDDLSPSGTIVKLSMLKHKTPLDVVALRRSLARRFSRFVRGQMDIRVNSIELPDPTPPLDFRMPDAASGKHLEEVTLPGGDVVKYWYGFAHDVIHERELRGFSVMVHGKVAQAPPFFFDVEAKASGQHATRYVIGEIEADFLDGGVTDEGDLVSTDRQEIDWEDERVTALKIWGEALAKKVLRDCTEFRGLQAVKKVMDDPSLKRRIDRLDRPSQQEINKFLRILGNSDDTERSKELASTLVRAYEFRQFHDVIEDIQSAAHDPNQLSAMLGRMSEWRVLESRAILEIVKGRLDIIAKFESMLANDAPETASKKNPENLHDLLAGYPWILNPEWQVLSEERSITRQLREWGDKDIPKDDRSRYDFLALGDEGILAIIEIKRPDHAAELDEIQRLQSYANKLSLAHGRPIHQVFICGREVMVAENILKPLLASPSFEIRRWNELFDQTRRSYEHYRAVLEGTVEDIQFGTKEEEVARTRHMLEHGIRRGKEERKGGIPPPDFERSDGDEVMGDG